MDSKSEIAEKVKDLFESQALKDLVDRKVALGIAKYGQTLDVNYQPVEIRAAHAIQEGVDKLQYLGWMAAYGVPVQEAMLAIAHVVNWLHLRFPNAPLDHAETAGAQQAMAGSFDEWRERGIGHIRDNYVVMSPSIASMEESLRNMLNTALSRGYADGMKFAMTGALHEVPVEQPKVDLSQVDQHRLGNLMTSFVADMLSLGIAGFSLSVEGEQVGIEVAKLVEFRDVVKEEN